jgi:poly-gamma-glutamate synthesis protein (capsule biosynthesis protein)
MLQTSKDGQVAQPAGQDDDYLSARGKKDRVSLLAFGDMLLDRYIKKTIDKYGTDYPFQNIKSSLTGNDLTLANLEGVFTDFKPNKASPNMTSFTFDPKLVPAIKNLGFNILLEANNHSQDFGKAGLAQSQAYLEQNGIDCFGTYSNEGKISTIKDINGIKIGFVGYDEFGNSFDDVIAEIKKLKPEVDHVVIFAHWGIEYQTNSSDDQRQKGRQFIDAGADLVLGGHPHVVQPLEIYKSKLIFYSLGNFVFDQVFSQSVQRGLAVGAVFTKDSIDCYLMPTQNKNFVVNFAAGDAKTAALKDLAARSVATSDFKEQIAQGEVIIKTTD